MQGAEACIRHAGAPMSAENTPRPWLEHDGRCDCGAIVPCEESGCCEPPGHAYDCPECLQATMRRPDPFDVACERRHDGY